MGEVYRARDTKLGREVAIKLLLDEVSADPERLARFEREARVLASLNHPHIGAIYGLEEANDTKALVLELVDGPTLADRIEKGPLPIDEAMRIARQIAEALEVAHEQGIIHRDLKPANVKVRHDGAVKVLDFGLAKTTPSNLGLDRSESPTLTAAATQMGTVIGTPAYMSPEQARGHAVDPRADIWAFGCILYEMLTGRRAFVGSTTVDVLGAIVASRPDWSALPTSTPAGLLDVLHKCLEKAVSQRFSSIAAVRVSIERGQHAAEQQRASVASAGEKSLIVLPFVSQSPNPEDDYFTDGLTEELVTDLSRIRNLRTVPSAASFRLKDTDATLQDIAREFKVRYALGGRVRKAGNSVRITAQLVDAWDDRSIWAERYTGDLDDAFALQEEVSRAIASALELQLEPPRREPHPEAKEAYLRGRHSYRQATSAGFQRAVHLFEQACSLDPDFASAFAALAEAYVLLTQAWDALAARDVEPKARAAAQRALDLNPRLSEAHTAMGLVAMFCDWDLATAEGHFREALQLNPGATEAYRWYAALLIWLDTRYDDALEIIDRGLAADPTNPLLRVHRSWVYFFSRDFERAVEEARQLTEQDPYFGFGHYALGCSLVASDRAEDAVRCFERGIELDGRGTHHVALLGLAHALAGHEAQAANCLTELEGYEREGRDVSIWKLHHHVGRADADQVLRCLEEAIEARSSSTLFALIHPFTDFVADDPRFHALLERAGLEYLIGRRPQPRWLPPQL
jgi:serine/threonine-protein kinase